MRIEDDIKLDYSDVLIRPKRSTLTSRYDVDMTRTYRFVHSREEWTGIPIMAANMDTVGTFETAKRKPTFFLRLEHGTNGYHTPSRTRHMYHNGKRIKLDPNDPGGEHE